MTDKSKSEFEKIRLVKPGDGLCEVYSNYIDVVWSLYDVTVRFAELVPLSREEGKLEFEARENARVTFAWPQAKALGEILTDLVSRFELVNGEIKPLTLVPASGDQKPAPKTRLQ